MSQAEYPVQSEAQQILSEIRDLGIKQDRQAEAINNLGVNLQWMIDMAKPLLEMLNSPMFGQMMPGVLAGAMGGLDGGPEGN